MKFRFLLYIFFFTLSVTGQTVFKTPSGEKYHLESCRMVKNTSEEITISKANELGLTSCKICNPPRANTSSNLISNKIAKGESSTVQCKGQTKAGAQCKRKTSIGNGYCFQHKKN